MKITPPANILTGGVIFLSGHVKYLTESVEQSAAPVEFPSGTVMRMTGHEN